MAASRLVLITAHIDESWHERLKSISPEVHIVSRSRSKGEAISEDLWDSAEVIYTFASMLPPEGHGKQVRWIHLYSAGADLVVKHPLFLGGTLFTTSSGVHAINIGEYVLSMILAWYQRVRQRLEGQENRHWASEAEKVSTLMTEELHGKTIGILGYGSIGRHVARLASGFGMRVLAMQRGNDHRDHGFLFPGVGDPDGSLPERYYPPEQFHAMLGESDVVVIAVPLTPATHGMFDRAAFQAMKREAFLVNIARGEVCNEPELIQALQRGQIAGAALDVFEREPLPPESPLWGMSNVFVTPHVSGLTQHYNDRAATIFAENLRRYLTGEPLYNLVEKTRGY